MSLSMRWADIEGLRRFDNALKSLGQRKMRQVSNRALNKTGDQGRTQVKRVLAKQTGLAAKFVSRHLKVKRSSWDNLEYRISSRGRDIPLKHFKPKEVAGGTRARPFGKSTLYPNAFFRGGRFPSSRVAIRMKDHVFQREGKARLGIVKVESGVIIPEQMVKDASAKAWLSTIGRVLPIKIAAEIDQATDGVFS